MPTPASRTTAPSSPTEVLDRVLWRIETERGSCRAGRVLDEFQDGFRAGFAAGLARALEIVRDHRLPPGRTA